MKVSTRPVTHKQVTAAVLLQHESEILTYQQRREPPDPLGTEMADRGLARESRLVGVVVQCREARWVVDNCNRSVACSLCFSKQPDTLADSVAHGSIK